MSTKVVQTRFFMRKGSGTFFVYGRFCGGSTQSGKQAKAGYHRGDGILPFVLYGALESNRCVRPYMVGTHVRRKKRKFRHIGVFFRFAVWYTQLDKSEVVEVIINEKYLR